MTIPGSSSKTPGFASSEMGATTCVAHVHMGDDSIFDEQFLILIMVSSDKTNC
jgi:hypothetical protein